MTIFITNPDNIFYLTGFLLHETPGREAYLVMGKKENLYITDGRLIELVRQKLPADFTPVEKTPTHNLIKILSLYLKKYQLKNLGFEKADLTVLELERLRKALPGIKFLGTENVIENRRVKKSAVEIAKIKKAASITDQTFTELLSYLQPGLTELEIVWKIKTLFDSFGAASAFEPIIASGKNSAIPHYISSAKKLQKGELVLLDFGAKYKGYCSDMSRVVFLGKADNKTRNIYHTVLTAQEKALKLQTKSAFKIDQIARETIINAGFASIPHGVGHGVGIAIHEQPRLNPKTKDVLKPGMVFTIEPGIYLPLWGGIRIEDLVLLTNHGLSNLTNTPKQLIEL